MLYQYHGLVTYIVDGDTVDVLVDLGFKISVKVRVRLNGVDAPEMNSSDLTERTAAKASKEYLSSLILNKEIHLDSQKLDKYGRSVGTIYLEGLETSVNQMMVDNGHAKVYIV